MKSDKLRLEKMIPPVVLPEGYRGKILLVSISIGAERVVVLRSGDLWHREILPALRETDGLIGRQRIRHSGVQTHCLPPHRPWRRWSHRRLPQDFDLRLILPSG